MRHPRVPGCGTAHLGCVVRDDDSLESIALQNRQDADHIDVTFVDEADPGVNDQIDAAYRAKYRRFGASYVDPMVADGARAATLKLAPR